MGWAEEFAGELRQRDNRPAIGPQIGQVISAEPLRIALLSDAAILERAQIYLCTALAEEQRRTADIEISPAHAALETVDEMGTVSGEGTVSFKQVLTAGDLVACIPVSGIGKAQKFIVIDKVVAQ